MFGGKAEYQFLNRRLQSYAALTYTSASGQSFLDPSVTQPFSVTDYQRTLFAVGARFEFVPRHYISVDGNLISFDDKGRRTAFDNAGNPITIANPSFTDYIVRIFYEHRF
jgi:hypothetical protein